MLLQLVLSQKTEKGTDSYFASQENFTPECMMPWAWVEKIDRTWVRDDCVAATPALGNFSSFFYRELNFFFLNLHLPLQSLLTPRKKRVSLNLIVHKLGCFLEVPGVLLKMLRLGSYLQCLNSLI